MRWPGFNSRTLGLLFLAVIGPGTVILLGFQSLAYGWYWPRIVPQSWTVRAWLYVASEPDVRRTILNSFVIATIVASAAVTVGSAAARAIAMHRWFRSAPL